MSTRVLVADNSSTMRKIILRSLSAVGVSSAVEAADGDEAIKLFNPGDFDLVLTDWNMPGKNGLEVIQSIRARDANVPIIHDHYRSRKVAGFGSDPSRGFRLPCQAIHCRHAPRKA